jgi:preprotein translocase subunit YajC
MENLFSLAPLLQATAPNSTVQLLTTFLPFAAVIAIFYFMVIRPQNKKQKETQNMLNSLRKGDKIITAGGAHGVISSVKEGSVIVKVDDNCKIEFSRSSISSVIRDEKAAETENQEKTEKSEKAIEDKSEKKA